jgi:predicted secreted protein
MKKALLVIFTAAMSIAIATSPAPSAPLLTEAGEVLLELQPEYSRNLLKVMDMARITLDENRTTGYVWHYEFTADGVVEIFSDMYISNPQYDDRPGTGGTRYLTLQATSPGKTAIKLICKRGDSIDQTAAYHISVIPAYLELLQEKANMLTIGEYAMFVLDENPSVGDAYTYNITGNAVKVTADKYISNPCEEGWTGVGYVRYIVFEAVQPGYGEAIIELVYKYRGKLEWEKKYRIVVMP